jgi:hypothetical protein
MHKTTSKDITLGHQGSYCVILSSERPGSLGTMSSAMVGMVQAGPALRGTRHPSDNRL